MLRYKYELKTFCFEPVNRQANWLKELNAQLISAVSVEIYLTPAFNQGEGEMTLNIFAIIRKRADMLGLE